MTNTKTYHNIGTVPISNIKIIERGHIDTPNRNTWPKYMIEITWHDTNSIGDVFCISSLD
jgi:hypothetical protein